MSLSFSLHISLGLFIGPWRRGTRFPRSLFFHGALLDMCTSSCVFEVSLRSQIVPSDSTLVRLQYSQVSRKARVRTTITTDSNFLVTPELSKLARPKPKGPIPLFPLPEEARL